MRDPLEVRVSGGLIRGAQEGSTRAWRGIPFAAPPVGARRFLAPRPVIGWRGVRDTTEFGPVAPQAYRGQFRGVAAGVPSDEDCLSINVIAPAVDAISRMPVMVFIHGGGYSSGSSRAYYGQGDSFVRSGRVIYVSFNYRLGALGYLDFSRYSTRRRRFDRNLGLRDQVAALRWVRANIRRFGGDPGNVTVFGESAGANAVTTLLATPSARGLFARAIAQSSPADAVYSADQAAVWAAEFIDILRERHPNGPPDAVSLLTATSATELVTAALTLQLRSPDTHPGMFCLAPVIDRRVLPRRPLEAFRTGKAHRVPLIIGTNDREGTVFRGRIDILPRSPSRVAAVLERGSPVECAAIATVYSGLPASRPAMDFAGDYGFWYPSVKVADFHSRFAPVHVYRFDVAPRLMRLVGLDATHGIEMYALFDQRTAKISRAMTALGGWAPFSSAGERMRDSWLRFALALSPSDDWPLYTEGERLTMIIAEPDRVEADPRGERRRVWERFLPLG